MSRPHFLDRTEAGELLASKLLHYRGTNAVILAIPRGGVPVGHALARVLGLPLDIVLVKKIGHPVNREFAIGAVSPDALILDERFEFPVDFVQKEVARIRAEMEEQARTYRGDHAPLDLRGRTVIVVDDGVATGHTLLATIDLVRRSKPAHLVVAMPVVPANFVPKGREVADEFIHLIAPADLMSVGQYYGSFAPVEDAEVVRMLNEHWNPSRT